MKNFICISIFSVLAAVTHVSAQTGQPVSGQRDIVVVPAQAAVSVPDSSSTSTPATRDQVVPDQSPAQIDPANPGNAQPADEKKKPNR